MSKYVKNCFLLITIFLSACANNNDRRKSVNTIESADSVRPDKVADSITAFGYFKPEGDSLIIPSFEIEIHLSPKARAKLTQSKETIIVSAYFLGVPKDTTSQAFRQSGEMGIAGKRIETGSNGIAKFENIKFAKALLDSLADPDIELLINVFSGRRSSPDNLLNCGMIQEKMSTIKGKKFTIDCKLIYGDD